MSLERRADLAASRARHDRAGDDDDVVVVLAAKCPRRPTSIAPSTAALLNRPRGVARRRHDDERHIRSRLIGFTDVGVARSASRLASISSCSRGSSTGALPALMASTDAAIHVDTDDPKPLLANTAASGAPSLPRPITEICIRVRISDSTTVGQRASEKAS